jgi:hypothetical protein
MEQKEIARLNTELTASKMQTRVSYSRWPADSGGARMHLGAILACSPSHLKTRMEAAEAEQEMRAYKNAALGRCAS